MLGGKSVSDGRLGGYIPEENHQKSVGIHSLNMTEFVTWWSVVRKPRYLGSDNMEKWHYPSVHQII
jgi:hypothetical protein